MNRSVHWRASGGEMGEGSLPSRDESVMQKVRVSAR